jgi:GTPase
MFVDECKIIIFAGHGGHGCVSFRREKFVAKGGPDGGDGGRGGNIYLKVNPNLRTLVHLRNTPRFRAGDGGNGLGKQMTGANGKDLIIEVPLGTVLVNSANGELVADAVKKDIELVLARGGKGGKGNQHFKRPDRRTPRFAEKGRPGGEMRLDLTLSLLADVGLIGLPNAGKSTLLSRLSNARPKVANYPFTTLEPILGIVPVGDYGSLLLADLPGLIEGAAGGKGLGQRFLRHIERTRFLLLMIESCDPNPLETFDVLKRELDQWSVELSRKEYALCYTKIELLTPEERAKLPKPEGMEPMCISSHTGEGLDALLYLLEQKVPLESLEEEIDEEEEILEVENPPERDNWLDGERPWPTEWIVPDREGAMIPNGITTDTEDPR